MSTSVANVNERQQSVQSFDDRMEVTLVKMRDKFAASLPAHIPADRFVRVAANALTSTDMQKVGSTPGGRMSVFTALLRAASDGLLVDGREAALVKMNIKGKDGYEDRAAYMPMVAGIMKKARNSGEIAAIFCDIVYANDGFTVSMVTAGVPIDHNPRLGDRGDMIGVYAVALLKTGEWTKPEIMDKAQVDAIRSRSRTPNHGPWATDYNEMARKTVIRRAAKYWPSSTDKDGDWTDVTRDEATEAADVADPGRAVVQKLKRPAAAALLAQPVEHEPAERAATEPEYIDADVIDEPADIGV